MPKYFGVRAGVDGANGHHEAQPVRRSDLATAPELDQVDTVLGGDQAGIRFGDGFLTQVVLVDPLQAGTPQRRHVGAHQRLDARVARLSHQHRAQARGQIGRAGLPFAEVGEAVGEGSARGDLQQHLGQVHPWQSRGDGRSQGHQAHRLIQPVQGREDQLVLPITRAGCDPHRRVGWQPGGDVAIGGIQPRGQPSEGRRGVSALAQGAANHRPGRLPRRLAEQPDPGVGIAHAGGDEEIAPAQGRPQPLQGAEHIRFRVHGTVGAHDVPPPTPGEQVQRRLAGPGPAEFLHAGQVGEGRTHGFPGRGGAVADRAQQRGQEAAHPDVGDAEFLEINVLGRAHQRLDLSNGGDQVLASDPRKGGRSHLGFGEFRVQQRPAGTTEGEGGAVQVLKGAKACALPRVGGCV